VGVFFQDDYQISRKLTLNLGLRYEYFQPPVDTHDLRFAFDPTTGNLIVPNQRVLTTQVSPVFPKNIPIVTAQTAGYPSRSLVNPDHKDFGPRIGLAYRPFPNNKTVIRTGYGIFYSFRRCWAHSVGGHTIPTSSLQMRSPVGRHCSNSRILFLAWVQFLLKALVRARDT
jgi:outer membrane receptor protein involved in Fe transport